MRSRTKTGSQVHKNSMRKVSVGSWMCALSNADAIDLSCSRGERGVCTYAFVCVHERERMYGGGGGG